MRQRTVGYHDSNFLEKVREGFAEFRREGGRSRKHCPDHLRALAVAAANAGYNDVVIAKAGGVHPTAVGRWRRDAQGDGSKQGQGKLRELRLVKDRGEDNPVPKALTTQAIATLRIGHHMVLDLPITALTDSFVRALISVGGAS